MRADQQWSLSVPGRPSRRGLDPENVGVRFAQGRENLTVCRPAIFGKPSLQILCGLGQGMRCSVGMTFSDQRLQMAENAGPSVRQGRIAVLRGDFCSDAFACKHLEENGMRYAAIDDMRLSDPLFESIETGMDFRQHAFSDGAFLDHSLNVFA